MIFLIKSSLFSLRNYEKSKTVVFLDTPYFENEKLSIQREILISKISKKYKVIVVPHQDRENLVFNSYKYFIWDGEISILLENYYRLKYFQTISVDLIQGSKLYITCPLRASGSDCLDEDLILRKLKI